MTQNNLTYTSQSATSLYQECNYKRYLQYHAFGHGITAYPQHIPLLTGSCVHEAIEVMVKDYLRRKEPGKKINVDLGVRIGRENYIESLKGTKLFNVPAEEQERIQREQIALVEVLIRLWVYKEWAVLIQFYKIIGVEFEIQIPIAEGLIFQSKPDLLLIHKRSGALINYSLKTIKGLYATTKESYEISNQAITEPWATNQYLSSKKISRIPEESSGIRFCYLIKGDRKEKTKGNKDYYTQNPFLYSYKKVGIKEIEYAWSYWTLNSNNKSGYGRLGKGWDEWKVFEEDGMIEAWMKALWEGQISNDLGDGKGDVFSQYIDSSPESEIRPRVREARIQALIQIETKIQTNLDIINNNIFDNDNLITELFPMNTHSCYYPSKCEYLPICPNGNKEYRQEIAENPLAEDEVYGMMFRRRVPHHRPEKDYLNASK